MQNNKKKEDFYFANLYKSTELAEEAIELLIKVLQKFKKDDLQKNIAYMHEIEQRADMKRHKLVKAVSEKVITTIERENLLMLSNYIDDITDAVEDILRQIYISDIEVLREDMTDFIEMLGCEIRLLKKLMKEFSDFRHSKMIDELVIKVNEYEEKGDHLYLDSMRKLYQEADIRTILIWKDIYQHIEDCMDICEYVADTVEAVYMSKVFCEKRC